MHIPKGVLSGHSERTATRNVIANDQSCAIDSPEHAQWGAELDGKGIHVRKVRKVYSRTRNRLY